MIFLKQASHLSSNDIWGRHRRELSSVPAPHAWSTPRPQAVITSNAARLCQVAPGEQKAGLSSPP